MTIQICRMSEPEDFFFFSQAIYFTILWFRIVQSLKVFYISAIQQCEKKIPNINILDI